MAAAMVEVGLVAEAMGLGRRAAIWAVTWEVVTAAVAMVEREAEFAVAPREVEWEAEVLMVEREVIVAVVSLVEVKTEVDTCLACNRPCLSSRRRRRWAEW